MVTTTYTTFGSGTPFASLTKDVSDCLSAETPTAACDAIIGSAESGAGFCADEANAATTYCACVNNNYPCPQVSAGACANSRLAYRPTSMVGPDGKVYRECDGRSICINAVIRGGSDGRLDDITQECNGTLAIDYFKAHPYIVMVVVILLILIALGLVADLAGRTTVSPDATGAGGAGGAPDASGKQPETAA